MKNTLLNFCLSIIAITCLISPSYATGPEVEYENIGTLSLEVSEDRDFPTTQLILTRQGGMRDVIDNYEGLLPAELKKLDIDFNGNFELVALLKHPDGHNVVPYIYDSDFSPIFPLVEEGPDPIICREFFMTSIDEKPALCSRYLVSFHNFGPPNFYRLEYYQLESGKLKLFKTGFSEGDHFNVFMNRGAYEFNQGNYLEALKHYSLAIDSSTGEMGTEPFIETLYYLAESRRFSKDFDGAKKLYQKIVLQFPHNSLTDASQDKIELISTCQNDHNLLSLLIDASLLMKRGDYETAIALLDNEALTDSNPISDRFLFAKAEALTASNRLDEAITILYEIISRFPQSQLIDTVISTLESIEDTDEEADGI